MNTSSNISVEHNSDVLIRLFNQTFLTSHRTRLVGGGEEPEYIPACNDTDDHKIIFTQNYFASALHEVAHWCVAGEQRRQQVDYGYWYTPDGRTPQQQQQFEKVEVKPQAIEWLFSRSCGARFRLSADNLNGGLAMSESFKQAVCREAKKQCVDNNDRVALFSAILAEHFSMPVCSPADFSLEELI
ncbi:elongation factor P hydroxylase [Eionea flava]